MSAFTFFSYSMSISSLKRMVLPFFILSILDYYIPLVLFLLIPFKRIFFCVVSPWTHLCELHLTAAILKHLYKNSQSSVMEGIHMFACSVLVVLVDCCSSLFFNQQCIWVLLQGMFLKWFCFCLMKRWVMIGFINWLCPSLFVAAEIIKNGS